MAIFNFFSNKKKPTQPFIETKVLDMSQSFGATSHQELSCEERFGSWPVYNTLAKVNGVYINGPMNLYPDYINNLYTNSPLLSAIINFKRQLTVGNGYRINKSIFDIKQEIPLKQLTLQFDKLIDDIAFDYFLSSKFYIEVTWNDDHTRIIKLEYIPHEKIRVAEVDEKMNPVQYEYCYDWRNVARFPRKTLYPFSVTDRQNKVQLDYWELRSPGQIIYNRPKWESAVPWAEQDKELAVYHTANISNSINPSAIIKFFKDPNDEGEKTKILNKLNKDFAGARKSGKLMAFFSSSQDVSPQLEMVEPNKLDKGLLGLTETTQRQIAYANSIDPAILGIRVSGQLGQGVTLMESFTLFNYNQIVPAQKDIESFLNKYLSINGISAKIELNKATNLFNTEVALAQDVNSNPSAPEIATAPEVTSIKEQAQASLRGSVGGVQGIIQIQTAVSQGIADYEAAITMLNEIFGFTDDVARKILGTPKMSTNSI